MKKNNLPYKSFAGLFLAGWLIGLLMAPLFISSSPTSAILDPTGMSVITSPAPEQLSLWDRFRDYFSKFKFRSIRPWTDFSQNFIPTNPPPGMANLIQELCQQEKQNATAMIARYNEIASQNNALYEASVTKAANDAIKVMNDSAGQLADLYIKNGYPERAKTILASMQRYIQVYQKLLDDQRKAREDGRKTMTEFWQSYLETRFNC